MDNKKYVILAVAIALAGTGIVGWMYSRYKTPETAVVTQNATKYIDRETTKTVTLPGVEKTTTQTATVTATIEIPTIPPNSTLIWQADGSSDNLSYSEFYTLTQVEDYIASCNLTVTGNCYEWMMALANKARYDGKPIGLALMFNERADGAITDAHFTNFVIIGKKVLRIEPQTGQISNWDGWRLAIP